MKHLYFANIPTIISTVLIVVFFVLFSVVLSKNGQITHWGRLVILVLMLGLAMSILSGMKDGVGTTDALFPAGQIIVITASILGGLAFLAGFLALIIRKQEAWQFIFYAVSGIIIVKTMMVEISRIVLYLKK